MLLKGGNFKYACLCNKVYSIKNTKFTILSTQLHVRRSKLGYWNDLLLCKDYMKITSCLLGMVKLQVGIFVHYYPSYKAAMTFFQYLNLYKKHVMVIYDIYFILIPVPFCDTKADFQIRSGLFVPNWFWNKSKIILKTPMFGCTLMTMEWVINT